MRRNRVTTDVNRQMQKWTPRYTQRTTAPQPISAPVIVNFANLRSLVNETLKKEKAA